MIHTVESNLRRLGALAMAQANTVEDALRRGDFALATRGAQRLQSYAIDMGLDVEMPPVLGISFGDPAFGDFGSWLSRTVKKVRKAVGGGVSGVARAVFAPITVGVIGTATAVSWLGGRAGVKPLAKVSSALKGEFQRQAIITGAHVGAGAVIGAGVVAAPIVGAQVGTAVLGTAATAGVAAAARAAGLTPKAPTPPPGAPVSEAGLFGFGGNTTLLIGGGLILGLLLYLGSSRR